MWPLISHFSRFNQCFAINDPWQENRSCHNRACHGKNMAVGTVLVPCHAVKWLQLIWRSGTCTWWRHQMETFSALLAFCEGNSPVTGEFPAQRPVTRSFDVFFDQRWINGWVNNREAGDLRCHRAHYVIVMDEIYGSLIFKWASVTWLKR